MYLRKQLLPNSITAEDENDSNNELDNSIDIYQKQPEKQFKAIYLKSEPKASKLSSCLSEIKTISWKTLYQKLFRPMLNTKMKPKNGTYLTIEEIEFRLKLLLLQIDINSIFTVRKHNSALKQNKIVYAKLQEEKDNDVPAIISHIEDKLLYNKQEKPKAMNVHSESPKSSSQIQSSKETKKRHSLINSFSHSTSIVKAGFALKSLKKLRANVGSIRDSNVGNVKKSAHKNQSILLSRFEGMKLQHSNSTKMKELCDFLDFNQRDKGIATVFGENLEKRMNNLLIHQSEANTQMEQLFLKIKTHFAD